MTQTIVEKGELSCFCCNLSFRTSFSCILLICVIDGDAALLCALEFELVPKARL